MQHGTSTHLRGTTGLGSSPRLLCCPCWPICTAGCARERERRVVDVRCDVAVSRTVDDHKITGTANGQRMAQGMRQQSRPTIHRIGLTPACSSKLCS